MTKFIPETKKARPLKVLPFKHLYGGEIGI